LQKCQRGNGERENQESDESGVRPEVDVTDSKEVYRFAVNQLNTWLCKDRFGAVEPQLQQAGKKMRCRLVVTPNSLIDAMRWQLVRCIAENRQIRLCPVCGSPFEDLGRGRRCKKKYCGNKCSQRHA
jgi:hypothetical protein